MAARTVALSTLLLAGCWQTEPSRPTAPPVAKARATRVTPVVELVREDERRACEAAGTELEGGLACDGQSLEGGAPLRYRRFPAIARDGSVLAVVEERDGWGHVRPGVRLIDRDGRTVEWLALGGTGDAVRVAIVRANAALASRDWVVLEEPAQQGRELADDLSETTLAFAGFTATYRRRNDGNTWLPPSQIRVVDARGRVVAERTDTERAWAASPACNMPRFELVGASASPGVLLFRTGLGMGGHNCDGVVQPPAWHVLTFAP